MYSEGDASEAPVSRSNGGVTMPLAEGNPDWLPIPDSKSGLASTRVFIPSRESSAEGVMGRLLLVALVVGRLLQTICPLAKVGMVAAVVEVLTAVDRWRSGITTGLGPVMFVFDVPDWRTDCGGGRNVSTPTNPGSPARAADSSVPARAIKLSA